MSLQKGPGGLPPELAKVSVDCTLGPGTHSPVLDVPLGSALLRYRLPICSRPARQAVSLQRPARAAGAPTPCCWGGMRSQCAARAVGREGGARLGLFALLVGGHDVDGVLRGQVLKVLVREALHALGVVGDRDHGGIRAGAHALHLPQRDQAILRQIGPAVTPLARQEHAGHG